MITIEALYSHYLKHPVVCTDTRSLSEGCIFFALKGLSFDGNKFASLALEKGASVAEAALLIYTSFDGALLDITARKESEEVLLAAKEQAEAAQQLGKRQQVRHRALFCLHASVSCVRLLYSSHVLAVPREPL